MHMPFCLSSYLSVRLLVRMSVCAIVSLSLSLSLLSYVSPSASFSLLSVYLSLFFLYLLHLSLLPLSPLCLCLSAVFLAFLICWSTSTSLPLYVSVSLYMPLCQYYLSVCLYTDQYYYISV